MVKVAVVTGANGGIGKCIVAKLCKQIAGGKIIVLTSQNVSLGEEAVKDLRKECGCTVECFKVMQLDITSASSIKSFTEELKSKHGGIDILVNNAGFAYKQAATEPFLQQVKDTMAVNYFGTLNFSKAVFPLLRADARVVNVASMAGSRSYQKCSDEIKKEFSNPNLTEEQLTGLVNRFIDSAAGDEKTLESKFTKWGYGMSKLAVLALTNIQARSVPAGTLVNACCPGWCKTDMAGYDKAPKTAEEGADTPAFLALLPAGSKIHGKFLLERLEREW